jgi:hypothetical protein
MQREEPYEDEAWVKLNGGPNRLMSKNQRMSGVSPSARLNGSLSRSASDAMKIAQ